MAWYTSPGVVLTSLVLAGGAVGAVVSDDSVEVSDTPSMPAESIVELEEVLGSNTESQESLVETIVEEKQEVVIEEPEIIPTFIPEPIISESYAAIEEEAEEECHPSYSGCLNPNASDYDCAGGSGDGPYYTGAVQVYGHDEFGLDKDHDGWGCE